MAKSSFTPASEADISDSKPVSAAIVKPVTKATAIVPAEPADSFFRNGNMEGEFDRSDLQIPGLNLVQAVGPLSEHFTPGQMIYNKEEVLDTPVEVTILRMKKFYQEKLPYGSEVLPRRFNTQEEARSAGLVPAYEKTSDEDPVFEPVLDTQILIGGDPEKHPTWPLEFNGKRYALARFFLRSVAYSQTGKMFISATQFGLREGLHTGYWHITPKREKVGANMVWLPKSKLAGKHTPEFITWVSDKL
jgi:hypothetical protein